MFARGRLLLAATALFAMLVVQVSLAAVDGANASSSKEMRGDVAASSSTGTWVGVVHALYSYDDRDDGATFHTLSSIDITARANGTARATGDKRVDNRSPNPGFCSTIYREQGSLNGPVGPPRVNITPPKYQVDYSGSGAITPLIDVTIFEQGHRDGQCREETRTGKSSLLGSYTRIEGRATRNTTRVVGSRREFRRHCSNDPDCDSTNQVSWDLHLVGAVSGGSGGSGGGGSGGGGGGGGGGGFAPGAGCEKKVRSGTSLDDELIGTGRDELLLALAGNDLVRARRGNDCLFGGAGDDVLSGGTGGDLVVGDEGIDRMKGGRGKDEIRARDGNAEVVRCGKGFDVAKVDRADDVKGCERVRRG